MNPSLKEFKSEFQSRLLDLLWRQWSALGVAGEAGPENQRALDPEALLLLTCSVGRCDPRLFDEVLDWLHRNGRLINVMRLKRILRIERFAGAQVLAAIAGLLAKGAEAAKWKQLAATGKRPSSSERLFWSEDGKDIPIIGEPECNFARFGFERGPLRLRGYSQEFRPTVPATAILQLRALFGINIRSEILLYLLTHASAHPSQIARDAYFFERAVQGTLAEMSRSGVVQMRATGREKHYWLQPDSWSHLLKRNQLASLEWVTWPALFSAFEQIWLRLQAGDIDGLGLLLQASEVRQLMMNVRPAIERANLDRLISDDRQYLGESYLPAFITDVRKLLA